MTLKLSPKPYIRWNSITKWRLNSISTLQLSLSSYLSMFSDDTQLFGQNHRLLTGGIQWLRAWVGVRKFLPTPLHSTKLWPQAKRSTPSDCNLSLDSYSATLLVMTSDFTYSCPSFHGTLSGSPCIAHCVGDRVVAILMGLHIIFHCVLFSFHKTMDALAGGNRVTYMHLWFK